ncbi:MAG: hypothetical protein V4813_13410 [Gemmatimonadota bacterium]
MYRLHAVARTSITCVVLFLANTAQGQGLVVRPMQNLTFGLLLPGVPTTVDAAQVSQSAQIEVRAIRGASLEVRFTLPTVMTGAGTTLPLSFSSTSGGAAPTSSPASMSRFDPNYAARFTFLTTARATFFLGGRALPRIGQPPGSYTATVVMTITNLGL